ncbi:MAG: DUF2335 domain-containing protein [Chitinophagales bacterium]|jgi:uncharacterized membrane protein
MGNMPKNKPGNINLTQQKTEINITNNNLPDPKIIEQFQQIQPDFAERIMVMTENEQKFRHSIISQESQRAILKYWIALIVFLVLIGLIVFSIILNALTVASILAGTTILGVISLFLNREKRNNQ